MKLFSESGKFLAWAGSIYRILLRHSPRAAVSTVVALVVAQFAQLLAFFIPLKVLILVGSDGVPRYLRGLIEPGTEMHWIVGLTMAAIVLYVVSILLDQRAGVWSRQGAQSVLRQASKIVILNNQDESVQAYYRRICGTIAAAAILVVGLALGLAINAAVFALLALLVAVQFVTVAGLLHASARSEKHAFERWLADNFAGLLKAIVAVDFLTLFLLLLAEFLLFEDLNLILAILSLLLGRRVLQSGAAVVIGAVRLGRERETVDALFVRERALVESEDRPARRFRELFAEDVRQVRSLDGLRESFGRAPHAVRSVWSDGGVDTPQFEIALFDGRGASGGHVVEKIFFPRRRALGRHEAYLLAHVDVAALHAPRLIEEFVVDDFFGLRVDTGAGPATQRIDWRESLPELLLDCWAYAPPEVVIETYMRTKPMLWARLDRDTVGALAIAACDDAERACLERFASGLEAMADRLRELPLCVHNPDLEPGNARVVPGGGLLILNWGRWTVEPVGAGLRGDVIESELDPLIAELHRRRRDAVGVQAEDLVLVARWMTLERLIGGQRYRKAIELVCAMLEGSRSDAGG